MQKIAPAAIVVLVVALGILGVYYLSTQNFQTQSLESIMNNRKPTDQPFQTITPVASNPTPTGPVVTPISSEELQDGLKIADYKIGTGSAVKAGDTVVIDYVGMLENGQVFDSSLQRNQPFETQIGVGKVIKGWDEGVVGMQVGGRRRLIIPASLGYGEQGAGGVIPPNATLIFDVQLLQIK